MLQKRQASRRLRSWRRPSFQENPLEWRASCQCLLLFSTICSEPPCRAECLGITLNDAAKAIDFYKRAFGATEQGRFEGPDKQIMHAEILIGNAAVMLNDEVMGCRSPRSLGGSPVAFYLYFEDADAAFKRAIAAGAKEIMPVTEMFWGDRVGHIEDPFGYQWNIASRVREMTHEEIMKAGEEFMKKQMSGAR